MIEGVGLVESRAKHVVRALPIPFAILAALVGLAVAWTPAWLGGLPIVLIVSMFVMMSRIGQARRTERSGSLAIRNESIWHGGLPLVPREDVREAALIPNAPEGTLLRLSVRRGADIDLRMNDVAHGRAALEMLELDAAHHAATFVIRARDRRKFMRRIWASLGTFLVFMLVSGLLSSALKSPAFMALAPIAPLILALSIAVPARATVGTDGIVFRRLFVPTEFIPLDAIEKAVVTRGEPLFNSTPVIVELRGKLGEIHAELFVDSIKEGPFQEAVHAAIMARAEGLAERINEAIAARGQAKSVDPAALARGDRDAKTWIEELRTLLSRAQTFRATPPSIEALTAIVEDATAPPITRAAAAAALSTASREVRARLRVAADATAAPALRVALEAAAEDDPERLAEAMEKLG